MPYIQYDRTKFAEDTRAMIDMARIICENYAERGYDLTLRQLYYQFVSRDLIVNSERSYKRLGTAVNKGRMNGLIDWEHITDRGRNFEQQNMWSNPAELMEVAARQYRRDLWEAQNTHVEVWVEKEALASVIARTANRERVGYLACKGYMSASEMWVAGQRISDKVIEENKRVVILHLGDHDPSGIDMTRDIEDRLTTFAGRRIKSSLYPDETFTIPEYREQHVEVRRIALTMDQIRTYDPPPNPAKVTDSRANDYIERYGTYSWELDALDPETLDQVITGEIEDIRDEDIWNEAMDFETEERDLLRETVAALRNGEGQ